MEGKVVSKHLNVPDLSSTCFNRENQSKYESRIKGMTERMDRLAVELERNDRIAEEVNRPGWLMRIILDRKPTWQGRDVMGAGQCQ